MLAQVCTQTQAAAEACLLMACLVQMQQAQLLWLHSAAAGFLEGMTCVVALDDGVAQHFVGVFLSRSMCFSFSRPRHLTALITSLTLAGRWWGDRRCAQCGSGRCACGLVGVPAFCDSKRWWGPTPVVSSRSMGTGCDS